MISLQAMDFQRVIICWMFYGEEIPKTRTSFFQTTVNFESSFNNFGNFESFYGGQFTFSYQLC